MKFLFDNNLSPRLSKAIGALCDPLGVDIQHIREKFSGNTPDVEWIGALATEGDWCIITQDRLTKKSLEKEALRRSGLIAFILAKGWSALKEWDKAWHLVRWWPRILEQAALVEGGAAFQVPVKFSGKGKFTQIRL